MDQNPTPPTETLLAKIAKDIAKYAAALICVVCLTCSLLGLAYDLPKWAQVLGTLPALYVGLGLFTGRGSALERDMQGWFENLRELPKIVRAPRLGGEREFTLAGMWLVAAVGFAIIMTAVAIGISWQEPIATTLYHGADERTFIWVSVSTTLAVQSVLSIAGVTVLYRFARSVPGLSRRVGP